MIYKIIYVDYETYTFIKYKIDAIFSVVIAPLYYIPNLLLFTILSLVHQV